MMCRLPRLMLLALALLAPCARGQCLEWNQLPTPNRPADYSMELVYDRARHTPIGLMGGHPTITNRVVLYQLNNQGWTQVNPLGPSPLGPRLGFGCCYHPVRQTILLFGGYTGPAGNGVFANDFWEWDGTAWTQIQHAGPWPPATGLNFLAYDPGRQRVIMLGKGSAFRTWLTWEWTGTAWEAGPDLTPVSSTDVTFCFDEFRRVGFVYTLDPDTENQEVWEYTPGATAGQGVWGQIPINGAATIGNLGASLVYDPYHRRIIRQGGRAATNLYAFSNITFMWNPDLREWEWPTQLPASQSRGASGACFDTDLNRIILYGGVRQDSGTPPTYVPFDDTWAFTDDAPGIIVDVAPSANWCPGQSGVLSISVAGSATVQWYKNNQPIPGATSTILVVNPVSAASAGVYECLVTNSCGGIWSRPCTASVTIPPAITSQPTGADRCPGQNVNIIGPTTSGTNPQVFLQRHNGFVWVDVPFQYNPVGNFYVLTNAQNSQSGEYRFEARNACGAAQSNQFHIQVGVSITQQTPSQAAQPCSTVVFNVTAQGVGPLSYIWRRNGTPLTNDGHFSGTQSPTLTINGMRWEDEGVYTCLVSDSCETQTTGGAYLAMQSPPQWIYRTSSGPSRRPGTDMVFDTARGVCVLYGGWAATTTTQMAAVDETWEWDGVEWTRRFPAHNPGPRWQHEMVYDSSRNKVLLFGGWPNGTLGVADVWEYDGNDWTLLTTSPNGPPTSSAKQGDLAFDSVRARMILLAEYPSGDSPNETWEFNSITRVWQRTYQGPGPYWFDTPLVYDAAINQVLGTSYAWYNLSYPHTWRYTGSGWIDVQGTLMPSRQDSSMAFDTYRQKSIMFACCRHTANYALYHNDTYSYDGATWNLHLPEFQPVLADRLQPAGMAFDSRRNAMVVVGNSYNTNVGLNPIDTWEYRYLDKVVFDRQPASQPLTIGATTQFKVAAAGAGTLTYQWRKGGAPLANGQTPSGSVISGAQTPTLTISSTTAADAGAYSCLVSNACGGQTSSTANLGTPCYPNCDGSTVAPVLTANDFQCFINAYAAGSPQANCDNSTVQPVLTANDFQCFINAYAAGCTQ